MNFHEQLKALAEQELGITPDESQMTFKERMAAKKAKIREQVRANLDKRDALRKAEHKRAIREAEVKEFQKQHNAKIRQKDLERRMNNV